MAKTKKEKQELIKRYSELTEQAKMLIFTTIRGLKTREMTELRQELSKEGIDYLLVKNRLLGIVFKKQKIEIPQEILDQPLAVAFSSQDDIKAAKIIFNFNKEHSKMEILGGAQVGEKKEFVSPEKVKVWAMLPDREQLYSKLVALLQYPTLGLIFALRYPQLGLLNLLKAKLDSLQNKTA